MPLGTRNLSALGRRHGATFGFSPSLEGSNFDRGESFINPAPCDDGLEFQSILLSLFIYATFVSFSGHFSNVVSAKENDLILRYSKMIK